MGLAARAYEEEEEEEEEEESHSIQKPAQISNFESRITNHESRITSHESRIRNHKNTDGACSLGAAQNSNRRRGKGAARDDERLGSKRIETIRDEFVTQLLSCVLR